MTQQSFTGNFYVPSDILVDDQEIEIQCEREANNAEYLQEVDNMLATILETNRQMEATGQEFQRNFQFDLEEFISYQEKYPHLVKKVQKKFKKFNLATSQLLKFIKIQEKFMNLIQQQSKIPQRENKNKVLDKQQTRKSRKNLVQVHGILMRRKSYQLNPRMYH